MEYTSFQLVHPPILHSFSSFSSSLSLWGTLSPGSDLGSRSSFDYLFSFLLRFGRGPGDGDVVRLQVLFRYIVRGLAHEVVTPEGLGEGDDITDAGGPDHEGDESVQT